MNECMSEVVKGMCAAIKETGMWKLFSANLMALQFWHYHRDDHDAATSPQTQRGYTRCCSRQPLLRYMVKWNPRWRQELWLIGGRSQVKSNTWQLRGVTTRCGRRCRKVAAGASAITQVAWATPALMHMRQARVGSGCLVAGKRNEWGEVRPGARVEGPLLVPPNR